MFEQTVSHALSSLSLAQRDADPHPRQPTPMSLGWADKTFSFSDWIYEPKWDDFRHLSSVLD